ncbi:MAG: glutaredoxin domain-containing protein [Polyangiaceae bacterium]
MTDTPDKPAAEVVMYRTRYCGYCVLAARLFAKKGVAVREIDVSGSQPCREWLLAKTGSRTVPQIFINGRSVLGFEDVALLDRRGELDVLLREPPRAHSVPPPCAAAAGE